MYYSELVKKACLILFDAHKEDTDKGGYPYVFHPFYLATQMDDETSACVALLHDVVEDHGDRFGFAFLKEEGFPDPVIGALRLLTHEKDVPYMEYVKEIGKDPVARKVKIADLRHNLDAGRNGGEKPKKYDLYWQALRFLEETDAAEDHNHMTRRDPEGESLLPLLTQPTEEMFSADAYSLDAKVDVKGRITIPKDVRAALGAARGGKVTFIVADGEIRVVNVALHALAQLQEKLTGAAKRAGFQDEQSVSDWVAARRKEDAR